MNAKLFDEQAVILNKTTLSLITQVLTRHTAAVLEQLYYEIKARDVRIAELEEQLKEEPK